MKYTYWSGFKNH